MTSRNLTICLIALVISGCSIATESTPVPESSPTTYLPVEIDNPPVEPSQQPTAAQDQTPVRVALTSETPTVVPEICSPLHGFQIVQLKDIISTPFDPPSPGNDSGHHGVEFGFYSYGAFSSMEGLPVQSVLRGKVAAVIDDRPPYGNMVIIESPFSSLPAAWQEYLDSLPKITDYKLDGRLVCPMPESGIPLTSEKSLYLLYAHMADNPQLMLGEEVGCGQQIGFVGNSGFSGNIHLHLEIRFGPAGVQFLHLAHYINDATAEEMSNYCTWRISDRFRLIDPIELLTAEQ